MPSVFPSIRVFSSESALHIRWPKYWSFSFNISPSNEHPGLISFRMHWLDDQWMLAIWSLVPLPFLNPAWTTGSSRFTWTVEAWLGEFWEFASMWDECSCVVVWTVFDIAFLWDWNEKTFFQLCVHCWVFQICWHIGWSTFTISSFRIWNSLTGIPSPPLALFVVMLLKAHLTLHSRMSGSRWSRWSYHCGYLGHEYLFYIVLLWIVATPS